MTDILKYLAALPFNQMMLLLITVFIMIIIMIIVLAKNFRIEKISTRGIEFDTDGKPAAKTKRRIVRRKAVVRK